MRKASQEITDKQIIEEILKGSTICRLAIKDNDDPYLLPFNFGYKDHCIYIHSAPEGKKIELIKKHPRICFEMEQYAEIMQHEKACKWETTYRSVVGYGRIEILRDKSQKQAGLDIIMAHNGSLQSNRYEKGPLNSMVILKLTIDTLTAKQSSNWNKLLKKNTYTLESNQLLLKEITWDDLENIHQLHSYPEVDKYNTLGIPANIEETRSVIKPIIEDQHRIPRKRINLAISLKSTSEFIGLIGISLSANRFKLGEIFYNIIPEQWNKGYATEAAKTVIKFGFEQLHLHKIEAGVATENTASIKVLEKLGMTREGLRRKILPIRGRWKDNYHYAIVEDDKRDY